MSLQVIGSGLGRTGTMSLKLALEQLGFGPCHHMIEVFAKPERVPLWIEAGAGRPDWEAIYEGYVSAVDYPSAKFWRELAAFYPQAKVIHTTRDPENWFASTQQTIFAPRNTEATGMGPFADFFPVFMADYADRQNDHDFAIDHFRRHNEAVLSTIVKDRLLVFEARQGWEPLCKFLGVSMPDTPFPRENTTDDFKKRFMSGGPPRH